MFRVYYSLRCTSIFEVATYLSKVEIIDPVFWVLELHLQLI